MKPLTTLIFIELKDNSKPMVVMRFINNDFKGVIQESTKENIESAMTKAGFDWKSWEIVKEEDLLLDRTFRNAWKKNGKKIKVDMDKAREIQKEHLRRKRQPLLDKLDIEFMKALEEGKDTSGIVKRKQELRDVTDHPSIKLANTPEELKLAGEELLNEEVA